MRSWAMELLERQRWWCGGSSPAVLVALAGFFFLLGLLSQGGSRGGPWAEQPAPLLQQKQAAAAAAPPPRDLPLPAADWAAVTRRALPHPRHTAERWIVLTSINPPTQAVRQLAALPGWQVIVIGDTKSPASYDLPGAIFLDVAKQKRLGYRVHDLLPYRSYARKNLGYLYAIQHGAKIVYETDDDNILIVDDLAEAFHVNTLEVDDLVVYKVRPNRSVVNPYVHFGQPSMWPRGYPLDAVATNGPEPGGAYWGGRAASGGQLVQQGLADGDPDVDAIFRLTRRSAGSLVHVRFDASAPPVALPPGVLAPFNSQNTLFHAGALWGLLIPVSTAFRVCDIWRGYWAQRLLWDAGGQLAFYPPFVRQDRNAHDYAADLADETALYLDARRLVDFLNAWSSAAPTLFDRALELSHAMYAAGFWGYADVLLTRAWLLDLVAVGYEPPAVHPHRDVSTAQEVTFVPKALTSSNLAGDVVQVGDGDSGGGAALLGAWRAYFDDMVLVVNYNHDAREDSVHFWRALYSRIFRPEHILFLAATADPELGVEACDENQGWTMYSALPALLARFPAAAGILWINDDVVLNYWNLAKYDKSRLWLTHGTSDFFGRIPFEFDAHFNWHWTFENETRELAATALAALPQHWRANYERHFGSDAFTQQMSDVFYVPLRHAAGVEAIVPIFYDLKLKSENAIPMLFLALEDPAEYEWQGLTVGTQARFIWGTDREAPEHNYTAALDFLHGWKPSTPDAMFRILKAIAGGDPTL